jgi:hypothetical protein
MDHDIEEQLKAIPKRLPQIVPGSSGFLALTSPEATDKPAEMLGKVTKYNDEVEWYNNCADAHDDRLREYKRNATEPGRSSSALESYTAVRIGNADATGLSLSLDDVDAAYKQIPPLIKADLDIPVVRDIGSNLATARSHFEHSQSAFRRLQNQVALELQQQAALKELRELERIAVGMKPDLVEQLEKLDRFGDLQKPLSVDAWKSQTQHTVIGRDSRLTEIDAPLADLNEKLTGLEKLVKENPGKLERFTQDLVKPDRSEYLAYL